MPKKKKKTRNAEFKKLVDAAWERNAKRKKKRKFNITPGHLAKCWKKQTGICPYCGIEMDLKGKTHEYHVTPDLRATVDRLDSSKGYVRGNVALAHHCCNRFKGQLPYVLMYAIAKHIVDKFEADCPETKVTIDKNLRSLDGLRNYMYPRYTFTSSGRSGKRFSGEAEVSFRPNPPVAPPSPPPDDE
jgi:hypothetical protein